MKKVNTEAIEQMAKEKNIDKDKIQQIADGYMGKSENELMDELVKIGKTLQGKEEVVSKLKNFLDDDQRKKIDLIMNKISNAEVQDKIDNKKSKTKKSTTSKPSQPESNVTKKTKTTKTKPASSDTQSSDSTPKKKTKKIVKRVKKSSSSEE